MTPFLWKKSIFSLKIWFIFICIYARFENFDQMQKILHFCILAKIWNFHQMQSFLPKIGRYFVSAFLHLYKNLNFLENAEKSAFPHFCVNANSDRNAENSAILHFCMHLKFDQNAEVTPHWSIWPGFELDGPALKSWSITVGWLPISTKFSRYRFLGKPAKIEAKNCRFLRKIFGVSMVSWWDFKKSP